MYQLIKQASPWTVKLDSCQIFAYGSRTQLEAIEKCTVNVKAKSKRIRIYNFPHAQGGTWITS